MKDSRKLLISLLAFAVVVLSIMALASVLWTKGNIYGMSGAIVLGLIIALFAVFYLKARSGRPFQDERTRKILLYAGSKAFTLSIWWLLILMYLADDIDIIPRHVAAAGIFGMALLFFISWIWYDNRGVPE